MKDKIGQLVELLNSVDFEQIKKAGSLISSCLGNGGKLLSCGNGGSASMSQHFVAELLGRFKGKLNLLPAIDLTSNPAVVTSLSNDYGYWTVFTNQVIALGKEGDILFCLTTSGESTNIVKAIEAAYDERMLIVCLAGIKSPDSSDVTIRVNSEDTQRIQEVHLFICHLIVEEVCQNLQKKPS